MKPTTPLRVPLAQAAQDLSDICRYIDDGAPLDDALKVTFKELKLDHAAAVDRRVVFFQNLDGSIDAARSALEAWKKEVDRLEAIKARMMEITKAIMEAYPDLPYQGMFGRLKVVNNGGLQPLGVKAQTDRKSVSNILSEDEIKRLGISPEYVEAVTYHVLINDSIRKAIESGQKMEWAELLPRGKRVVWQTKT